MKKFRISLFSFFTFIFITFTALKLTEQLDWSWTWITSPLWIPIVIALLVIDIIFTVVFIYMLFGVKPENTPFKSFIKNNSNNKS